MKWQLIIIMVLMMFPLVNALEECKGVMLPSSSDLPCLIISTWQFPNECGAYTISIFKNATLLDTRPLGNYSLTGRCNATFNYTASGSYLVNWSSGDSSKIILEGEDRMASLSVTLFVGAITLALFYLGMNHNFSKNSIANIIIKRCIIIVGLLLLSLDTAIIVTMADNAGLGVNKELFRYLWMINWAIYLFMVFLVYTTVLNILKLWDAGKKQKRMGNDNESDEGVA